MARTENAARLAARETYGHWTSIPIRFSDTDKLGHVNNIAIAAYIEAGRCELIYDLAHKAGETRLDFILAHMSIDFIAEIHFPGTVEIGSRIAKVGNKSLTTGYGVFANEQCCATSECVNVFFDLNHRQSCAPSARLREILLRAVD